MAKAIIRPDENGGLDIVVPAVEHVYECWVSTDQNSFARLKSDEKYPIISWLTNALDQLPMHGHIHIVLHDAKEYQG